LGQPSAKGIMLEPLRPASRGSADQRGFADRGIRIVTLALGGDLRAALGCTAIIMPSGAPGRPARSRECKSLTVKV